MLKKTKRPTRNQVRQRDRRRLRKAFRHYLRSQEEAARARHRDDTCQICRDHREANDD